MRLLTAHKILIVSAVVFFAFFGLFEMRNFAATGSFADLGSGVFGFSVAVGFGLYLRALFARAKRNTP